MPRVDQTPQIGFISLGINRVACRPLGNFLPGYFDSDFSDNRASDFILEGKNISQVALITAGPYVLVGRTMYELSSDPHAVT